MYIGEINENGGSIANKIGVCDPRYTRVQKCHLEEKRSVHAVHLNRCIIIGEAESPPVACQHKRQPQMRPRAYSFNECPLGPKKMKKTFLVKKKTLMRRKVYKRMRTLLSEWRWNAPSLQWVEIIYLQWVDIISLVWEKLLFCGFLSPLFMEIFYMGLFIIFRSWWNLTKKIRDWEWEKEGMWVTHRGEGDVTLRSFWLFFFSREH